MCSCLLTAHEDNYNKGGNVPWVEHMLETMRTDLATYAYFVNTFVSCSLLRGKNKLKSQVPSLALSCSDEAMALWFLESSLDTWRDMIATGNSKSSHINPKYTLSGDKGGSRPFGGWSTDGKNRFNTLFTVVEADRLSNGAAFDQYYKDNFHKTTTTKKRKAAPTSAHGKVPVMRNHLAHLLQEKDTNAMPPPRRAETFEQAFPSSAASGSGESTKHLTPDEMENMNVGERDKC